MRLPLQLMTFQRIKRFQIKNVKDSRLSSACTVALKQIMVCTWWKWNFNKSCKFNYLSNDEIILDLCQFLNTLLSAGSLSKSCQFPFSKDIYSNYLQQFNNFWISWIAIFAKLRTFVDTLCPATGEISAQNFPILDCLRKLIVAILEFANGGKCFVTTFYLNPR